ncbi:MAG: TonB-dependent receptor [Steroidobacteraceae bacterium]
MKTRDLLRNIPVLALGCAMPMLAQAQASASGGVQLEEIIVTAERRDADLQKTALAITVIDGDMLEQRGDADLAQVLRNVPGVNMQAVTGGVSGQSVTGGGGPPRIAIRGLGTDGPNKASSTAVYENGVLITGGGAFFHDINRVEVLRGPQGTLYGRGATGGAVNIISNNPVQRSESDVTLEYGSYNLLHVAAMANQPITDTVAARVAVNVNKRDALFNNGYSDTNDANARVKLLFQPSDDFSLLFGGVFYRNDAAGAGQIVLATTTTPMPDKLVTPFRSGASNKVTYKRGYAELNWNLGFGKLTYIPAYATNNSNNVAYGSGMVASERVTSTSPYDRTQTHELRLASSNDSALSWIAGAFYLNNDYKYMLENAGPQTDGSFTPTLQRTQTYQNKSKGLFGEATYSFTDALRLTLGVRQSYDDVYHLDHQDLPVRVPADILTVNDYSQFDWKARVETDLSDNNLLYGSVSTGYRPGGAVNGRPYDPETLIAYEIGSKNRVGERLVFNVSGYYYNYDNFQAVQNYTNLSGGMDSVIINAAAKFYGVEAEMTALLSANDRLSLSPSYIKSEFTDNFVFVNPVTNVVTTTYTKGKAVPRTPKFSVSADYAHDFHFSSGAFNYGTGRCPLPR